MNIYQIKPLSEEIIARFVPTRLYVKQHSETLLLYFGKYTKDDIYAYIGSGRYWLDHLAVHGKQFIETLWVSDWFYVPLEIQKFALGFSETFDIVNARTDSGRKIWANLSPENGLDGGPNNLGKVNVRDAFGNTCQIAQGDPRLLTGELIPCRTGFVNARNPDTNEIEQMPVTDERYTSGVWKHMSAGVKMEESTCEWCGVTGSGGNMTRYHHENCENNPANHNKNYMTACQYCQGEFHINGVLVHESLCDLNPNKKNGRNGLKLDTAPCQYCDREISTNNIPNHEQHCSLNPNKTPRLYTPKTCVDCGFTAPGNTFHWHLKKGCPATQ